MLRRPDRTITALSSLWNLVPSKPEEQVVLENFPESVKIIHCNDVFSYEGITRRFKYTYNHLDVEWYHCGEDLKKNYPGQ